MLPENLKDIVNKSEIDNKDQMIEFFSLLNGRQIFALTESLKQDAGLLVFLSENLKKKAFAIRKADQSLWDEIMEDERIMLKNLPE